MSHSHALSVPVCLFCTPTPTHLHCALFLHCVARSVSLSLPPPLQLHTFLSATTFFSTVIHTLLNQQPFAKCIYAFYAQNICPHLPPTLAICHRHTSFSTPLISPHSLSIPSHPSPTLRLEIHKCFTATPFNTSTASETLPFERQLLRIAFNKLRLRRCHVRTPTRSTVPYSAHPSKKHSIQPSHFIPCVRLRNVPLRGQLLASDQKNDTEYQQTWQFASQHVAQLHPVATFVDEQTARYKCGSGMKKDADQRSA